jgi:DNA repair protein RadC
MNRDLHEALAKYNLTPEVVVDLAKQVQADKIRGMSITSPAMTIEYLQTMLKSETQEVFLVIYLDTRHRVIEATAEFRGTLDGASVYPRVIAEHALLHGAAAIIVAHNHPSGNPEPSLADQAITRRLKDALLLLEIRLLDHFVIGDGLPVSLASRGML